MTLQQVQLDRFAAFLRARETFRIQMSLGVAREKATSDKTLLRVRLCNVHRCHDPTSIAIQRQLHPLRCLSSSRAAPEGRVPGADAGGALVFAAAVLRPFGSRQFVEELSYSNGTRPLGRL